MLIIPRWHFQLVAMTTEVVTTILSPLPLPAAGAVRRTRAAFRGPWLRVRSRSVVQLVNWLPSQLVARVPLNRLLVRECRSSQCV